ncbi:cell wall-binding repeat-containing protein [Candidatus Saccharibacteria bacterium]|nr:cell wall-binding repeat-containing protein [Candidatus Saccharibacteria bacterium]
MTLRHNNLLRAKISLLICLTILPITPFSSNASAEQAAVNPQSISPKTTLRHQRVNPAVERLSGPSAIDTSVSVSRKYYAAGTPVAYIVNHSAYADGIIAGAMKTSGPILYTNTSSLPTNVAAELGRLRPQKVVIVGGDVVVNSNVANQVKARIPATSSLTRLAGQSRYDTAVSVSKADYPQTSPVVYVSNGDAYADAIAGTQQGAKGPLLYINKDSIPAVVTAELKRLKPQQVIVIGDVSVVSQTAAQAIANSTGATITRRGGADRYATAVSLSQQIFPNGTDQVFIANGTAYADGILIGSIPTPGALLYVSQNIPDNVMTEIQRLGASKATIVGGINRVNGDIARQTSLIMRGSQIKNRLANGVSYFILAHPDDEIAAWAAIGASEYPVFILTTQGEYSAYCDRNGGKGSSQCKARRVSSWHAFLNNYHTVSDYGMQAGGFRLYKGANSARLVFDYGSNSLTAAEATQAINMARQVDYGVSTENYIASGNYWDNTRDPKCPTTKSDYLCGLYDHPEHRVIEQAIMAYNHPNKLTFHGGYNPSVNGGANMGKDLFESMIACPNGTYNQAYAWLSPPCWTRNNSLWTHWHWMREY